MAKWLACLSLLWLTACQSGIATECVVFQPIRPSSSDVLTDGTARQILAHNERGAEVCGWTP